MLKLKRILIEILLMTQLICAVIDVFAGDVVSIEPTDETLACNDQVAYANEFLDTDGLPCAQKGDPKERAKNKRTSSILPNILLFGSSVALGGAIGFFAGNSGKKDLQNQVGSANAARDRGAADLQEAQANAARQILELNQLLTRTQQNLAQSIQDLAQSRQDVRQLQGALKNTESTLVRSAAIDNVAAHDNNNALTLVNIVYTLTTFMQVNSLNENLDESTKKAWRDLFLEIYVNGLIRYQLYTTNDIFWQNEVETYVSLLCTLWCMKIVENIHYFCQTARPAAEDKSLGREFFEEIMGGNYSTKINDLLKKKYAIANAIKDRGEYYLLNKMDLDHFERIETAIRDFNVYDNHCQWSMPFDQDAKKATYQGVKNLLIEACKKLRNYQFNVLGTDNDLRNGLEQRILLCSHLLTHQVQPGDDGHYVVDVLYSIP